MKSEIVIQSVIAVFVIGCIWNQSRVIDEQSKTNESQSELLERQNEDLAKLEKSVIGANQHYFQMFADLAAEPVLITDSRGMVKFQNHKAKIFGDLAGQSATTIMTEADREFHLSNVFTDDPGEIGFEAIKNKSSKVLVLGSFMDCEVKGYKMPTGERLISIRLSEF